VGLNNVADWQSVHGEQQLSEHPRHEHQLWPCGTPDKHDRGTQRAVPTLAYCDRPATYNHSHLRAVPRIPKSLSAWQCQGFQSPCQPGSTMDSKVPVSLAVPWIPKSLSAWQYHGFRQVNSKPIGSKSYLSLD
jgi:hypothetical protein